MAAGETETTKARMKDQVEVSQRRTGWRRYFSLPDVLTAIYLVLGGVLISQHALWRDEAQAFLIGRDSHSVGELLFNLRLEGHPPLWHFLLFLLTRTTSAPEAMQVLHLALAGTTVYLVSRFSPFPTVAKCLFPFGYFALFEYGVIARNYQLVLLFSVIFCIVWSRRRDAYIAFGVVLTLLSLSHALGVILATGFGAMLVMDAIVTRDEVGRRRMSSWQFAVGCALGAGGTIGGALLAIPDVRATYVTGWRWSPSLPHLEQTITALCNAFVPVSPWRPEFWNRNAFQGGAAVWVGVAAGGFVLLSVIRSWRALVVLLVAGIGLLAFFYGKFFGNWCHHGALYIAWIAAIWVALSDRPWWENRAVRWVGQGVLVVLLGVQVLGAAAPVYFGMKYPFSRGREVADFLKSRLKPDDVLVSDIATFTTPVAAYLPGRQFYFPAEDRWGTFTLWTGQWQVGATAKQIVDFAGTQRHRVFLVHCSPRGSLPGAKRLIAFGQGLVPMEEYSVIEIDPAIESGPASSTESDRPAK